MAVDTINKLTTIYALRDATRLGSANLLSIARNEFKTPKATQSDDKPTDHKFTMKVVNKVDKSLN